ncbi:MAG: hypothetical protein HY901_01780 [Deltaproteobacteria bacterium]|nr:hypothetical protein [Deltaproteobacteria bacterium]
MATGILNILIGLALVGLGASGRFKLIGTSPAVLMVVGAIVGGFGAFQLIRALARRGR